LFLYRACRKIFLQSLVDERQYAILTLDQYTATLFNLS